MATLIGACIVFIIGALVYCVFELIDAWEENDFYNGYCEWHEAYISSTGENLNDVDFDVSKCKTVSSPFDALGDELDVDQIRSAK